MTLQAFKMAWKSISSNKMRSFLTMLGIIIGVLSLVVLVSLVNSTTTSVTETVAGMGSDYLTVTISDDKGNPLSLADVTALADDEALESTAPMASTSATATGTTDEEEDATVRGTTGALLDIEGLGVGHGRFLNVSDVENHTYVAVINAGLAQSVLGSTDVVGSSIELDGVSYQVVGVLAADGSDTSSVKSYEAYIPFTTYVRATSDASRDVSTFYASAADGGSLDAAETALETAMLQRFASDEDAFTIINQSEIAEAMESVSNTLALLLGGIAAISLLVGGIGIMNIMLVSVTERTREIGIRKAIGAGHHMIMLQFLIEALVVSLMGCTTGIVLSLIALQVISAVSGGTYVISGGVVAVATAFSLATGIIFGIYPANKAARMKPIDALRYTG